MLQVPAVLLEAAAPPSDGDWGEEQSVESQLQRRRRMPQLAEGNGEQGRNRVEDDGDVLAVDVLETVDSFSRSSVRRRRAERLKGPATVCSSRQRYSFTGGGKQLEAIFEHQRADSLATPQ